MLFMFEILVIAMTLVYMFFIFNILIGLPRSQLLNYLIFNKYGLFNILFVIVSIMQIYNFIYINLYSYNKILEYNDSFDATYFYQDYTLIIDGFWVYKV